MSAGKLLITERSAERYEIARHASRGVGAPINRNCTFHSFEPISSNRFGKEHHTSDLSHSQTRFPPGPRAETFQNSKLTIGSTVKFAAGSPSDYDFEKISQR